MILSESPYFLHELALYKYGSISFKTEIERAEFMQQLYTTNKNDFVYMLEQELEKVFTDETITQLKKIFNPIKTRLYQKLPHHYDFTELSKFYSCLYQYNLVNYNLVREYKNYPADKYLFNRGIDIFLHFLLERLIHYGYIYRRHNLPNLLNLIRDRLLTQGNIYMTVQDILFNLH